MTERSHVVEPVAERHCPESQLMVGFRCRMATPPPFYTKVAEIMEQGESVIGVSLQKPAKLWV